MVNEATFRGILCPSLTQWWEKYISKSSLIKHPHSWHMLWTYYVMNIEQTSRKYFYVFGVSLLIYKKNHIKSEHKYQLTCRIKTPLASELFFEVDLIRRQLWLIYQNSLLRNGSIFLLTSYFLYYLFFLEFQLLLPTSSLYVYNIKDIKNFQTCTQNTNI